MVVTLTCDPKLAKFLLSNPILVPRAKWLQIKTGDEIKLWLFVPNGVFNKQDRRRKKEKEG